MGNIKLFENRKVRTQWDEEEEQWYFSVIDVVEILTNSPNPRDYWFKMKIRIKTEDGLELSTICRQLKLKATDGKMRETDHSNPACSICWSPKGNENKEKTPMSDIVKEIKQVAKDDSKKRSEV